MVLVQHECPIDTKNRAECKITTLKSSGIIGSIMNPVSEIKVTVEKRKIPFSERRREKRSIKKEQPKFRKEMREFVDEICDDKDLIPQQKGALARQFHTSFNKLCNNREKFARKATSKRNLKMSVAKHHISTNTIISRYNTSQEDKEQHERYFDEAVLPDLKIGKIVSRVLTRE